MPVNFWPLFLLFAAPLPVGTDRRLRHIPWMTWALIALNVLVFALTSSDPTVFDRWGLVPAQPNYRSLFTYIFLHVGFWHLFWNMVFLWLFGPHVEDALGKVTFSVLYLGGGIAAGLLHMAITLLLVRHTGSMDAAPLVGASGAISSILAPFALRFHRANIRLFWLPGLLLPGGWARLELPALWGLGLWLLQNLSNGVWALVHPERGGTAYWAHIGGFVFGLVAAQITNLLSEGRLDYLLQDARGAAGRGQALLGSAVQSYRAFLEHHPEDAGARVELARALAQRQDGQAQDREEAALELLSAVRLFQKQGRLADAADACQAARTLGLPLLLASRERLRLAGAAAGRDDPDTAIWLLRALLSQTPDAPEDEMARFRLAQILLPRSPAEAKSVLAGFLDKYPDSTWTDRVREMLRQTYV